MIVGLRHAHVSNPSGVVYARLPGFHLSDQGTRAARDLASSLAAVPMAAIHSSPLERAVETATILAEPHGIAVRFDERLIEWSFWVRWQGLPWDRIRERDPELLEAYAHDPTAAGADETLEQAAQRVMDWAREADAAHPGGFVLGVSHEAPLVAALLLGSGRSLDSFHATNLPHLGAVRLVPGPVEVIDLSGWAHRC